MKINRICGVEIFSTQHETIYEQQSQITSLELVAILDAGWNSTQHNCRRGEVATQNSRSQNELSRHWDIGLKNMYKQESIGFGLWVGVRCVYSTTGSNPAQLVTRVLTEVTFTGLVINNDVNSIPVNPFHSINNSLSSFSHSSLNKNVARHLMRKLCLCFAV